MLAEKQRAVELARSRQRVQHLTSDLPSLIDNQVGEQIQKLETKLLKDFQDLGQRAVEESTNVLTEQLSERIDTLEQVSALQTETLSNLREKSRIAEQAVCSVVNSIESTLASAVPGFKLPPSSFAPDDLNSVEVTSAPRRHAQFQIEASTAVVKAETQEVMGTPGQLGYCPGCTSTDVRRARRTGLFEEFLRLFFIAPFRCRACRHKFYRF